jgi:hypothetical protein
LQLINIKLEQANLICKLFILLRAKATQGGAGKEIFLHRRDNVAISITMAASPILH